MFAMSCKRVAMVAVFVAAASIFAADKAEAGHYSRCYSRPVYHSYRHYSPVVYSRPAYYSAPVVTYAEPVVYSSSYCSTPAYSSPVVYSSYYTPAYRTVYSRPSYYAPSFGFSYGRFGGRSHWGGGIHFRR